MDGHLLTTIMGIIGGILSFLTGFAYIIRRFTQLEEKVNVMWGFQLKRGFVEATNQGIRDALLTRNSPIKLTPKAFDLFEPMLRDLKAYDKRNQKLPYNDYILGLEREFGIRITNEVCAPTGLHSGACLLIAAAIAKGEEFIPNPEVM